MKNKPDIEQSEENIKRRDGIIPTIKKVPYAKFTADTAISLTTTIAGLALQADFATGFTASMVMQKMLLFTLCKFTSIYESGEIRLSEIVGRMIPEQRYLGVQHFWVNAQQDGWYDIKKNEHPLIEISGVLSSFGPLTPAHPKSRPGYSLEGWDYMGDLSVSDSDEFDTQDDFLYGDRVIRLSSPRQGKFYAGLYDMYYGSSDFCLPLYIDQSIMINKKAGLSHLWQDHLMPGTPVTIKGRLIKTSNYYGQFADLPEEARNLPSFGVEVFEVKPLNIPTVTYISAGVGWDLQDTDRVSTQYFDKLYHRS